MTEKISKEERGSNDWVKVESTRRMLFKILEESSDYLEIEARAVSVYRNKETGEFKIDNKTNVNNKITIHLWSSDLDGSHIGHMFGNYHNSHVVKSARGDPLHVGGFVEWYKEETESGDFLNGVEIETED